MANWPDWIIYLLGTFILLGVAGLVIVLHYLSQPPRTPNYHKAIVCPCCRLPFSEWFWHPKHGLYCWPCYHDYGIIVTRNNGIMEEIEVRDG